MEQDQKSPEKLSRRHFLKVTAISGAGIAVMTQLSGCFLLDEPEMLVGTLDQLETQGFLSPKFNRKRIFTTKLNDEVITFSMVCTHKKCTVEWEADRDQFFCNCHEGLYDKEGYVLDGPPPAPLRRFKTEIRGNQIWVLNQVVELGA